MVNKESNIIMVIAVEMRLCYGVAGFNENSAGKVISSIFIALYPGTTPALILSFLNF